MNWRKCGNQKCYTKRDGRTLYEKYRRLSTKTVNIAMMTKIIKGWSILKVKSQFHQLSIFEMYKNPFSD